MSAGGSVQAQKPQILAGWQGVPFNRTTLVVLLTVLLGLASGMTILLALGEYNTLWLVGLLLLTTYTAIAVARRLAALVFLICAFIEFWGAVPEAYQIGPIKLIDVIAGAAILPLVVELIRRGFPFHGSVRKRLSLAANLLLVLVIGEVLLTTLSTGQDLWQTIKAGKPYFYYFGFLLVPVYAGTAEKVRQLVQWVTIASAVLAGIYLLASLLGESSVLPGLVVGQARFIGLGSFTRVRSLGAPFIVAMFLLQFYRMVEGRASKMDKIAVIILALGIIVHSYRSVWAGILGGIFLQSCMEGRRGAQSLGKLLAVLLILLGGISAIHPEYTKMILARGASALTEVEEGSGSYGVRQEQVKSWQPILAENWIAGIGFLHHDSPFGQRLEALYGMAGTGNYDVGWIDILGRLGVCGSMLFCVFLYYLTKGVWTRQAYRRRGELTCMRRTVAAYTLAGIISLPGFPLLSYAGGVFPLALLAGMMAVYEEDVEPTLAGD